MPQQKLLETVLAFLDKNHIDYMVTGSIASSLQGEPRSTHDADIVLKIEQAAIPLLIKEFQPPEFYLSEDAINDAVKNKSMFNLIDTSGGDKVDFWILTEEPYDQSRFKRKNEESFGNVSMKVSAPEDTILMKLYWSNLSGGSEKQFTDALRVYEVQYFNLNIDYIEQWITALNLNQAWEKLKAAAEPLPD